MAAVRLRAMMLRMLSGNATFALSQFLIVVVIARVEGAEALGSYALAQAVVSPVFAFTNLGMRSAIASDARYEYHSSIYFKLWAVTAFLGALISIVIANVIDLNELSYVLVFAIIISRFSESLSFVCYGFFQRKECITLVSRSFMLRGILSLLVLMIVLSIDGGIDNAVYAVSFAWLVVLLLIDIPGLWKIKVFSSENNGIKSHGQFSGLIRKTFPLGVLTLFTALTQYAPRFFIQFTLGTAAVGYFTAIVQLANVGALLVNAAGQTLISRLSKLYTENITAYLHLLIKAVVFAVIIGSLGILVSAVFGKQILAIIYSTEFMAYSDALVAAMVWAAVLFVSTTLGVGLTAARLFKVQAKIGGIALVFLLIACNFLIEPFGIMGAFFAMLISIAIRTIIQFLLLRRIVIPTTE